jgi:hypothetical protein
MRKTYKEMFPNSTGMFTVEQIQNCPYGGYKAMEQKELSNKFITVSEAAVRMDCSYGTARKYLKDVDCMTMDSAKVYYEKEAAVKIINAHLAKKEEVKGGKAKVS